MTSSLTEIEIIELEVLRGLALGSFGMKATLLLTIVVDKL
jgi:hypothetical protein